MPIPTSIANLIEQQLPAAIRRFLHSAGEFADRDQSRVFLVGGMVRDLLRGRPARDPDLVVQGKHLTLDDASNLAQVLAKAWDGTVVTYTRFGTAKVAFGEFVADISTARTETYTVPGALPTVTPATIEGDIGRRDFTINALAANLSPSGFGNLIDLHNGGNDLETGVLSIIHDRSFEDDPTRLLRAARYEARLGLHMNPQTESAARKAVEWLKVVSGDRIRHEFERIFEEVEPELVLERLAELNLLQSLIPALEWNPTLAKTTANLRNSGYELSPLLPLALLAISLSQDSVEAFIDRLNAPASWAVVMRDTYNLGKKLMSRSIAGKAPPSTVYAELSDLDPGAILAWSDLAPDHQTRELLINFYTKWRHIRPLLSGDDLLSLGVPQGPEIGKILKELLNARLDEIVRTRVAEEMFVRNRLASQQ